MLDSSVSMSTTRAGVSNSSTGVPIGLMIGRSIQNSYVRYLKWQIKLENSTAGILRPTMQEYSMRGFARSGIIAAIEYCEIQEG